MTSPPKSIHDGMAEALAQASEAMVAGEVPIGCVIWDAEGRTIGRGWNQPESAHDPTAHAEMLAIRQAAAALGNWRLNDCTLFVTLEPCPMCAGAAIQARVGRIVYGAGNPDYGAAGGATYLFNLTPAARQIEILGGIGEREATTMLDAFFRSRRTGDSR